MNEDFSELIKYLDKKFTKLDEEILQLRRDVSKEVAQLRGDVSKEIVQLRGDVNDIQERMATKIEVNKLLDAVDAYMKQGEDYRQEMLMLFHKVDRHEKWIQQIAEKLGIKLEY